MGSDYADVADAIIDTYICLVDQIDKCLDINYADNDCLQEAIKVNATAHFVAMTQGRHLKSQRAPSGASRSFEYIAGVEGIRMTNYGRMVQMLDTYGCFEKTYQQGSKVGIIGLGRKDRNC